MKGSGCALILVFLAGCRQNPSPVADPIAEIPINQQRTLNRSEFRYKWPFTVGIGTLGCDSSAFVFRSNGVNYALNEAARARGFAPVDPIRRVQGSGPPSNPLPRLKQEQRMEIFAAAVGCDKDADPALCRKRLRATHTLSDADWDQIVAEGRERVWPPLSPPMMSLDPLLDAGKKLCAQR